VDGVEGDANPGDRPCALVRVANAAANVESDAARVDVDVVVTVVVVAAASARAASAARACRRMANAAASLKVTLVEGVEWNVNRARRRHGRDDEKCARYRRGVRACGCVGVRACVKG